ncbi:MAG: 2-oxoglutarate oxidoreductase [Chloroflexi bacterium]|nr:2-oxoglutarate oxidoreductase [Chloroflexota bacterium]
MQRQLVAGRPDAWMRLEFNPIPTCPGCQEPTATRAVLDVLEEMGMEGEAILVPGVGCHSLIPFMLDLDHVMSAHGRPPDLASAIKRVLGRGAADRALPLVFTLQGDGDCIAIGAGSLVNAAARSENITVLMLNNVNYGTTGGQMSPTTPLGHATSTTPGGRTPDYGYPVRVPEMLATFQGVAYAARGAVNTPANYQKTRAYIKKAFQTQMAGRGLSMVEVLCSCPPDWHMTPLNSLKWIEAHIIPQFPLGEFKGP